MLNIFTLGTTPKVGKTLVSAGLAATMQSLGYSCAVYKPIQTGALERKGFTQSSDLVFVKRIDPFIQAYFTYMFKKDGSPLLAAESEGVVINRAAILKDFNNIIRSVDCTVIEGNECALTPIAAEFQAIDMAKELNVPILVVMSAEETTINNVLSTVNVANAKGVTVRGVVINKVSEKNKQIKNIPRLVEEYTDAKILGFLPQIESPDKINPNELITRILNGIDVESVFDVKISKLNVD